MKNILIIPLLMLLPFTVAGQKYLTKNGKVSFFSKTPVENIEAHNNQVNVAFDFSDGSMLFKVLIKSFVFEKALMQEHFNENYMESDKYPASTFKGNIKDFKKIDLGRDGTYQVETTGDLTIHGVTKKITAKGTIGVIGDKITGKSEFSVKLTDYGVKRPKAVAEVITITVNFEASKL